MTENEKKIIRKYVNGEKLLYKQLETIHNKYKNENIKYDPYIDFLNIFISDKLPDYKNYVKIKKSLK